MSKPGQLKTGQPGWKAGMRAAFCAEGFSARRLGLLLVSAAALIAIQLGTSPEPFFLPVNTHPVVSAWMAVLVVASLGATIGFGWDLPAHEGHRVGTMRAPAWPTLWPCALLALTWHCVQGAVALPSQPWAKGVLLACAGGMVAATLWRRHFALVALLALGAGVYLRVYYFIALPIDPQRADMLPLVTKALDAINGGDTPYRIHHVPWPLPLTYLPGTFLPYQLPRWLGVDLRWASVAAHVLALGVVAWVTRARCGKAWVHSPAFVVWAVFFLSPEMFYFDATNTASMGWLAMAWAVAALSLHSKWTGLAVGVALSTTPLTGALVPLAVATLLRWPGGPRRRWLLFGSAALTTVLVVGPFFFWDRAAFVHGVVTWFNDLQGWSLEKWTHGGWWARFAGFAGIFWTHGWQNKMRLVQTIGLLGLALLYFKKGAPRAATPAFAAASFVWFMAFNHMLWPYFYHAVFAMIALVWVQLGPEDKPT